MIRGRGRRRSQRRLGTQYQYYASEYSAIAGSTSLQALPAIDTGRVSKLIALGLLAGLAWVLYSAFTSPSFYVSDVEVRGNAMVPAQEIYAASQLDGMSIFWVDTEAVRSRIESLPGVKSAWVKTSLPATVTIAVEERMPQLVWKTGDTTWWIDTEGTVIQPRGVLERAITITDVDSVLLEVGGSIAPPVLARIAALHGLLPDLSEMLYSSKLGIGFTTGEGWPVYLGDEHDMETKLTVVKALRKQLMERGITPQLIDVRFPQRPFYR